MVELSLCHKDTASNIQLRLGSVELMALWYAAKPRAAVAGRTVAPCSQQGNSTLSQKVDSNSSVFTSEYYNTATAKCQIAYRGGESNHAYGLYRQ